MLEMSSLAPCVRPQLAFSHFCCTKSATALPVMGTENRQPGYDSVCQPRFVSGHTRLSRRRWRGFTSKHGRRLLTLASSFRDRATLISRGSARMPAAYSSLLAALNLLCMLPKPSRRRTSLAGSASHLFSVLTPPLTPAPSRTGLFTWNETGQHKEDGKREKELQ